MKGQAQMNILMDKIIIFIICILLNYTKFPSLFSGVIVILSALTVACIQFAFPKKSVQLSLISIYFLLAFYFNPLFLLFPLIIYDGFNYKEIITYTVLIIMSLISLVIYPGISIIYLVVCYSLSYYLYHLSSDLNKSRREIIVLKDTSTENKILAEERNEMILKNQTSQIYTATLTERNRIAREIHDNVGHLLTRSILQLAAIKTINRDENLTPHFVNLNDTLNQAMTSIRNSVHDLHDESIDLKSAVNEMTKDITNFEILLDYSIDSHIKKEIKYEFLAIIKESINNAVKYSNGNTIKIVLREHPAFYQLLIEDNGTNGNIDTSNGIGLKNITARVKNLNGTIKISTDMNFRIFISVMK